MGGTLLATCEEDGVILPPDLLLPFNEEMPLSISLVDAVRAVLKARGDCMTVAEVRDGILAMELDLHKLWNPTALVRKTLQRLLERGEVSGDPQDKPVRFRWYDPAASKVAPDPRPTELMALNAIRRIPGEEAAEKRLYGKRAAKRAAKRASTLATLTTFLRSVVS